MKNFWKNLFVLSVASVSTFALSAQDNVHAFATYNVRYLNDSSGENVAGNSEGKSWDLRGPYVFQIIENYDFDVVGFQEVTGRSGKYSLSHGSGYSQREEIMMALDDEYDFFDCERDGISAGKDYSYNMLAYKTSKYEAVDNGCFWLSSTPDVASTGWVTDGIRRTCVWAKLKVKATGEEFVFAVTHVNYAPTLDGPPSARVLVSRLSAIAGDLPVVLLGDFNMSRSHTAAYREYVSYFSEAATSADNMLCVPEENGQIAWTTTQWTTADKATSGNDFDHIFYRNMHANTCYTITENFGRGINPSDHYPVMGEFTLGNSTPDVYVDCEAADGGVGSKTAPFNTIAAATAAVTAGSNIHVTAGTYPETVEIAVSANIIGGYDSEFTSIVGKTVMDGQGESSRLISAPVYSLSLSNFKFCNTKSTLGTTDGAVYIAGASLTLDNVEFADNTAYAYGAGVYSTANKVDVNNCVFTGNTSPAGAALYLSAADEIKISNSEFSGNTATKYGVVDIEGDGSNHTIWNSTFANNTLAAKSNRTAATAKSYGGSAIYANYASQTPLNLGHNTIVGNNATYTGTVANFTGAAINTYGGIVKLYNNIVAGNTTVAEHGNGDVACYVDTDYAAATVGSTYNIYTSAESINYTTGVGDFTADSSEAGLAALAETLDGSVADGLFTANLSDCGGYTRVVKPIAQTYAGKAINILKETSRVHRLLAESTFGVDLNRDGSIDGYLTIDQRGENRAESTIPGSCEYIEDSGIDDIAASQCGVTIATVSQNVYVVKSASSIGHVAVYSIAGASVLTDNVAECEYTLDLNHCAAGVYIINAGDLTAKVIVK